jgi:hypothetical protein
VYSLLFAVGAGAWLWFAGGLVLQDLGLTNPSAHGVGIGTAFVLLVLGLTAIIVWASVIWRLRRLAALSARMCWYVPKALLVRWGGTASIPKATVVLVFSAGFWVVLVLVFDGPAFDPPPDWILLVELIAVGALGVAGAMAAVLISKAAMKAAGVTDWRESVRRALERIEMLPPPPGGALGDTAAPTEPDAAPADAAGPERRGRLARLPLRSAGLLALLVASSAWLQRSWVLWDVRFELKGHDGPVVAVCMSDDEKTIVTGSVDRTARVWDGRTGESLFVLRGHGGVVCAVGFESGQQRNITTLACDGIKTWDRTSGKRIVSGGERSGTIMTGCRPRFVIDNRRNAVVVREQKPATQVLRLLAFWPTVLLGAGLVVFAWMDMQRALGPGRRPAGPRTGAGS